MFSSFREADEVRGAEIFQDSGFEVYETLVRWNEGCYQTKYYEITAHTVGWTAEEKAP